MRFSVILSFIALPAYAQDTALPLPLLCGGDGPDWDLSINADGVEFNYLRESTLEIGLETRPANAQWPVALTMVGRGDTAIAIIDQGQCKWDEMAETDNAFSIEVLTQRGETPVLLVGCCVRPDL